MKILGFKIRWPAFLRRDRRKKERARTFEDLYVDYRNPADSLRGTGEGRDMGEEGVQFFSDRPLPVGIPVELTLRVPPGVLEESRISVHGRVLRCSKKFREKQYRVACTFDDVDEATQRRLATFVNWLKEREKKYLFFRYNTPE